MDVELSSPWPTVKHINPEQSLYMAIIYQAMHDIRCEAEKPGGIDNYARVPYRIYSNKAISWIFCDRKPIYKTRTGVTFRECCDFAGFDPSYWRAVINRYIARYPHLVEVKKIKKKKKKLVKRRKNV